MGSTKSEESARTKTRRFHFTVKALQALEPGESRYNVFDAHTSGLGATVQTSGAITFFHLKKVQGRPERTALGVFPEVSTELARGKASELNGELAKWRLNQYEGRSPLEKPEKVPTMGEVLAHYIENHLKSNAKNPDHAIWYANWQFDSYLASFRNRRLGTIRREHVRELHKEIQEKHGGTTANRTITFLRTLVNHAIHPDVALWDGANFAVKPKKFLFQEQSRERTIQRNEAPVFFKELAREPHRDLRDFVLLALTTAARRGTILSMRWADIDWEHKIWTIPNPKGKKGTPPQKVLLRPLALSVLKQRSRDSEWVFPGRVGHLTSIKKPWRAFLQRTGIQDFRIHDLRRSLITAEGDTGASVPAIQKTAGHARASEAHKIYDRSDRREEVAAAMDAAIDLMLTTGKTSVRRLLSGKTKLLTVQASHG